MPRIPVNSVLHKATRQFQAQLVRRELQAQDGNAGRASAELGIHRNTLTRILRQGAGVDVYDVRRILRELPEAGAR